MKLKSLLKAASAETLQAIGEFWGFGAPAADSSAHSERRQHSADYLYPRLQTAQYFRSAFDRLKPREKDLVYFLALNGGELGCNEVIERCFANSATEFEAGVQQLTRKGFVFLEDHRSDIGENLVGLPDCHIEFLQLPPHWKGCLGNLLSKLPIQQLTEIAQSLPGKKTHPKKPHLVYWIRSQLLDPKLLKEFVESLPEAERHLFSIIVKKKGFCLYRDLLDATESRRYDHQKAEQLNSLLASRGLVFVIAEGQNKYTDLLMIPRDIYYIVSNGFVPDRRSLHDLDVLSTSAEGFVPSLISNNSNTLLRDLVIFASHVNAQSIKRLTSGAINRNDLRKILAFLSANKPLKYAIFLASFMIDRKLLIEVGDLWKVSENFADWLENPRQCYRDIYEWWLSETGWNEELAEGSPRYSVHPTPTPAHVVELRKLVLQSVATIPREKWALFPAFTKSILPQIETAVAGRMPARGAGQTPPHPLKSTLAAIVAEPLLWLGLVSIGAPRDSRNGHAGRPRPPHPAAAQAGTAGADGKRDEGFAFQRTPLGEAVLLGTYLETAKLPEDQTQLPDGVCGYDCHEFIVQPNLEVIAPPDLALARLYFLSQFCVVRNMDVVTTLEITRDSLRGAMDGGLGSGEILGFLQEACRVELPATVRHLIDECSNKHGEACLGLAGGYIRAEEPMVIETIRSNAKLAPFIKDTVSENVLLLAPNADLTKLAREIRQLSLMPRIESELVHATTDERFHLTLTSEELCDLLAAINLVCVFEKELNADISSGKAEALAQKLKPEIGNLQAISRFATATIKSFEKRLRAALTKITDDIAEKYKNQVSRLVSKNMSGRALSKYNFRGQNPAVERDDIMQLLTFAREYELEAEILYIRQNDQEVRLLVTPKSFEGERLYAYCLQTDTDSMYSLQRILRARLP